MVGPGRRRNYRSESGVPQKWDCSGTVSGLDQLGMTRSCTWRHCRPIRELQMEGKTHDTWHFSARSHRRDALQERVIDDVSVPF